MLDTDTCAYAMKGHTRVTSGLASHRFGELAISVITEAELIFGALKSAQRHKLDVVKLWLLRVQVLELGSLEAEVYASVRLHLERAGQPIGPLDTLIAAHALAQNLVLVTNNEREFRRVPGLRVENWAA